MYKLSNKSYKKLIGVHPELGFAITEAIKITDQDFSVFEGVRTMARQKQLVKKGKSKTFKSYHLYGLAADLVAYTPRGLSWDAKYYKEIHRAMTEVIGAHGLHIDNGFDLWGWDMPHWQMTGYRKKYDIRKISPDIFKG